tara:strand:- start:304 stop:3381 length:3078 start_codon:yes stop_codon:yes gene_type:complete
MTEQILTLEDINNSRTLQSLGALAGDKVSGGKLIRIFSTEDDKQGEYITQEKINNSKTLQNLAAEPGDKVKDNKLIRMEQDSAFKAFRYGKLKGEDEGLIDYGTEALEAYFPTAGRLIDYTLEATGEMLFPNPFASMQDRIESQKKLQYQSPDQKYGEGFSEATPEVRREMIAREKERVIQRKFRGYVPDGGFAQTLGEIYGTIKDPSSIAPMGKGVGQIARRSAALGGTFSVVQDKATTGEIDPVKAGLFATAGAAIPLGIAAVPKVSSKVSSLYTDKTSKKTVNKAQAIIAQRQKNGEIITENNLDEIAKQIGVSRQRLLNSYEAQNVTPKFYSSVDEADKAFQAAIAEDSSMLRQVSKGADRLAGIMSTRLKNIDEGLYGRLMRFEYNTHKHTQEYLRRTEPFLKAMQQVPDKAKEELNYLLRTGKHEQAKTFMESKGYVDLANSFDEVRLVLDDVGTELQNAGYKTDVENYFPTSVKNYEVLRKALGKKDLNIIDDALEKARKSRGLESVKELTQNQRDRVVERVLRGKSDATESGLGQVKQRTLDEDSVTPDLMQHYRSPEEALQRYIRTSVNHVQKKNFFKTQAVIDDVGDDIDLTSSVDNIISDLKLDRDAAIELQDVISARFNAQDRQMIGSLAGVKNLGYIGTLGDVISTVTQLSDIPNIMGYHGFRNTVKAAIDVAAEGTGEMVKRIAKDPKNLGRELADLPKDRVAVKSSDNFKMDDIGIVDIAKEMGDSGTFSRTLDKLLSVTQFKRIDRFGKETLMNAVKKKHIKELSTKTGRDKFRKENEKIYGPDIDQVIDDLRLGKKTELTNLHMFTKLSEHQPISYSEYPTAYLNSPNGRILYMLKSFTLKQYDLVRRNIYGEMKDGMKDWKSSKKGSVKRKAAEKKLKTAGLKMSKVAGFMAAGGYGTDRIKDWMLGRDINIEDLPTDAMWSLASVYGVNKYAGEKYLKQGDIAGFADNFLTVPLPVFKGLTYITEGDTTGMAKHTPIIGRILHSRAFGGAEKYNRKKFKERLGLTR